MLAGEHLPRPPKAHGHLIGDQQNIESIAQLPHTSQKSRRLHDHPARALHDRLNANRGDCAAMLNAGSASSSVRLSGEKCTSNSIGKYG